MANEPSKSLSTHPVKCSALRKNGFTMLKGHPCKIVEMSTSAPGKHGHAKIHIVGFDVFTKKKYDDIHPAHQNVEVPEIQKLEMLLVSIGHEGYMSLMDDSGILVTHLALPDGPLGEEIRQKVDAGDNLNVVILRAMELEAVIGCKLSRE